MSKSNSVQGNNVVEELVERHHKELLLIARKYLVPSRMTHHADDAVQNAYLHIMLADEKTRYNPEKGTLIAWAGKIVKNACRDILRTESRKGCFSLKQVCLSDYLASGDSDLPAESKGNPLDRMCAEERRSMVRETVKELPEGGRDVIGQVYFYQRSYKETSEALNLDLGTVKSRMHIAKGKLKTLLK